MDEIEVVNNASAEAEQAARRRAAVEAIDQANRRKAANRRADARMVSRVFVHLAFLVAAIVAAQAGLHSARHSPADGQLQCRCPHRCLVPVPRREGGRVVWLI